MSKRESRGAISKGLGQEKFKHALRAKVPVRSVLLLKNGCTRRPFEGLASRRRPRFPG